MGQIPKSMASKFALSKPNLKACGENGSIKLEITEMNSEHHKKYNKFQHAEMEPFCFFLFNIK